MFRTCAFLISLPTSFQSPSSHLFDQDMGNMGKKPANTYISHWVVYRAVVVLHISYVSLTPMIGGLCHISNHNSRALWFRVPWHVVSLHLSVGKPVM